MTFFSLLKIADTTSQGSASKNKMSPPAPSVTPDPPKVEKEAHNILGFAGLRYNIEIHLPATKEVEVYNAIFKSLKEHLLDD